MNKQDNPETWCWYPSLPGLCQARFPGNWPEHGDRTWPAHLRSWEGQGIASEVLLSLSGSASGLVCSLVWGSLTSLVWEGHSVPVLRVASKKHGKKPNGASGAGVDPLPPESPGLASSDGDLTVYTLIPWKCFSLVKDGNCFRRCISFWGLL